MLMVKPRCDDEGLWRTGYGDSALSPSGTLRWCSPGNQWIHQPRSFSKSWNPEISLGFHELAMTVEIIDL
jgi:hypothetical protein